MIPLTEHHDNGMAINSTNSPSWESNRSPPILQSNANGQIGDVGVLHGSPGMDSSHTSTVGQLTNPAARDDMIRRKLRRGRSRGAHTSDVVVLG
jgi:hypothetical protein